MLDWIGSLRIRARRLHRVELCLTRSTSIAGWVVAATAGVIALAAWSVSPWLAAVPGTFAALGALLGSLRRTLIFDRDDGVLRIEQRILGFTSRATIPLFHLRAVVIRARAAADQVAVGPRFIAYVDRRVGGRIHLDESRRCAALLKIAENIAEVAELRLEYDATTRAAVR